MNAAQIHLALNHAPLFLSLLGGVVLIIGMLSKNPAYYTLSLCLLIAAAISTVPVFLTGEGTEELVEELPGISESTIKEHEEMAKISLVIIVISGLISLIGLFLRKNQTFAKYVLGVVFLFSVASFGTMARTAHLGGLIHHSEIRNSAGSPTETNENADGKETEEKNSRLQEDAEKENHH